MLAHSGDISYKFARGCANIGCVLELLGGLEAYKNGSTGSDAIAIGYFLGATVGALFGLKISDLNERYEISIKGETDQEAPR